MRLFIGDQDAWPLLLSFELGRQWNTPTSIRPVGGALRQSGLVGSGIEDKHRFEIGSIGRTGQTAK